MIEALNRVKELLRHWATKWDLTSFCFLAFVNDTITCFLAFKNRVCKASSQWCERYGGLAQLQRPSFPKITAGGTRRLSHRAQMHPACLAKGLSWRSSTDFVGNLLDEPVSKWSQSLGINLVQRLASDVGVGIESSFKPNRVTFPVSSDIWVVIPKVVVVEICFLVEVLARKS